jgi:hypothetical protein
VGGDKWLLDHAQHDRATHNPLQDYDLVEHMWAYVWEHLVLC